MGLLVIGEIEGEKIRGVAIDVPARLLAAPGVDFVVVEADGSRMRPAKAPAAHEPVVPGETTLLVVVAGIDALAGTIEQIWHRLERVAALLGLSPDGRLDAPRLAEPLCHPAAGLKSAPAATRFDTGSVASHRSPASFVTALIEPIIPIGTDSENDARKTERVRCGILPPRLAACAPGSPRR